MARAKKGAESQQALVITLVFFVLITIGLGVATYSGFADVSRVEDEKKATETKLRSVEIDREWFQFQSLMLRACISSKELSKDDAEALAALYKKWAQGTGTLGKDVNNKPDIDKFLKEVLKDVGWDEAKGKPAGRYSALKETLLKQVEADGAKFKKMDEESKAQLAKSDRRNEGNQTEIKARIKEFTDAQKAIKVIKDDKSKEYIDALNKIEEMAKDNEKLQNQFNEEKQVLQKDMAKLKADLKALENKYQSTLVKIAPVDLTAHDAPKGKIMSLDRTGGTAYINVGSAENVKPQLTFSIYQGGSEHPKGERKAALEVVSVLQAHLSVAKIIEVRDQNRDPVMTGDVLFNPVWSPGLKQHVAIAGLVDLTGDGSDSGLEFIRTLEKQNIVVDFYLDLRDMTTKGKMTFQTNFLVLGEMPELDPNMPIKEGDPRAERKKDVIVKLSEIQNDAGRLGIQVIPVRRFMTLIGYKLPRTIRPPDYSARGGLQVGNERIPPKGDGEGGDKEKAMPKDKEKAMEKDKEKDKEKAKDDK